MCTSVMAGVRATDQGVNLIARNEDCAQNNWNKYLVFRPHPEYYAKGGHNPTVVEDSWILGNGLTVPVPDKQFKYSALSDASGYQEATRAIGNRFFFEERGINECNVAISATNSMCPNEKAQSADPLVSGCA